MTYITDADKQALRLEDFLGEPSGFEPSSSVDPFV